MNSSHVKRLLTAAVAIPILTFVILGGGKAGFAFLVGLAAVAGLAEYYALFFTRQTMRVVGLVLGLAVIGSFYVQDMRAALSVLAFVFLVSAVIALMGFESESSGWEVLSGQIVGFVYLPFLLGHLILIREWNRGAVWIFFLLGVVFAGDIAAYYTGKAFGRHKLSPRISPGKTVEGAVGGLAANLLVGAVFKRYWLPEVSWLPCLGLLVLLGVVEQLGDLVESMLKRSLSVKDSGKLLPGHGGVLDRIDGLLFATPVLYYFKIYFL